MNRSAVRRSLLVLLLLAIALVSATASATEQTGKIRGTITDSSGTGLDGVSIKVQSSSMQGIRTTTSGTGGTYWLPGLPPGEYELIAELVGYQSYIKQELRISMGSVLTVNLQLSMAEVSESVVVVDKRPVIDTSSSTQGQVVTKDHLEALPTGRSYQSATRLTPGVTGGGNPNAQGGSSRENKWLLDGANTTDPVTGTFSYNFNLEAIEEIEVITGAFRAENGGTLGALINVRTRSGSNTFRGAVRGFYSNANWSPKRDAVYGADGSRIEGSEFDRDSERIDVSLSLGGPVLKDRIWFFTAVQYVNSRSTALGVRSPRVFSSHDVFAKLTVTPFQRHQLQVSVHNSAANISNQFQSRYALPEAQSHQHQSTLTVGVLYDWIISNNVRANVHYTHLDSNIDVSPQPCTWRDDDRFKQCGEGQPEGYIDYLTPAHYGTGGAPFSDNYYYYSINDRKRDGVRASLSAFVVSPFGTHEIKGGVDLSWMVADKLRGYPGNIYYVDRLEDEDDPSSIMNRYWRETQGQLFQRNRGNTQFVYLQDTWEVIPGLTIDLGAKYDRAALRNDVGEKIVGFDFVSPVGGIAWDPTGQQIAKIYVGGGIVADSSRLSVAGFLDKNGLGRKMYLGEYYSDRYTNYSFDSYSYVSSQSNYVKFDQLTTPRVYNIVAGFEVQPVGRLKLGVTGSAKLFRNLWEDDEVNYIWNGSGTDTIGVINGVQDNFFRLRTPNSAERNWYGLTFSARQEFFKNFLLDINYTLSMSRGLTSGAITAALDNPTQEPYEYGWLSTDRPHVLKASGAYRFGFGLQVGGSFYLQSGSRFDREYYTAKGFGGYENFAAERGTFDSIDPYWSVDLKVSYYLKLPHGKLFVSAELNNVTNNRATTSIQSSELNLNGEYLPGRRQAPMSLELGLGYDF
jgi:hypothetical protein